MGKVNRTSVYCLSAAAIALLLGGTATAHSAYKTITLNVDGNKKVISGFEFGTVADFLKKQGIQVGKEDLVQPAESIELSNTNNIVVQHAKSVAVKDGAGRTVSVHTQAQTTAELLKEMKINLTASDKVSPELTAKLKDGTTIAITRRNEDVKVSYEAIPFQTERQPDADSYTGTEKVLTPGVEGKATITTRVVYENGKEVDHKTDRQVTEQPVNQVVAYGTMQQPIVVASRSGESFQASKSLIMAATGYSAPGARTASGGVAGQGTVAVDPNVIPLGTKLYIEGYGYAVASDVGGAIKGNRIDLHFSSDAAANQWGVRSVTVYILN
ncbi:MAG: 3D domain-containing protein [Tumebacillaceae bacterium]